MKKSSPRGITLVELMVVVGIITLILSFAITNFVNARRRAQASNCQNNLKLLYEAGQLYRDDHGDSVTTLDVDTLYDEGFLNNKPECPYGGSYAAWNINSIPTCAVGTNGTGYAWDDHIYAINVGN